MPTFIDLLFIKRIHAGGILARSFVDCFPLFLSVLNKAFTQGCVAIREAPTRKYLHASEQGFPNGVSYSIAVFRGDLFMDSEY